jgi:hypothetical protein
MSSDELISYYRGNIKGGEIVIPAPLLITHYSSLITVFSAKTYFATTTGYFLATLGLYRSTLKRELAMLWVRS